MNWHTSYNLSEGLRLFLADKLEEGDLSLKQYIFAYDPQTKTLHWMHQVKPLVDAEGGGREIVHNGVIKDSIQIPEQFQNECAKLK